MISIFTDKTTQPTDAHLKNALADTYGYWKEIIILTDKLFPENIKEWFVSGAKYGWAFRIKDKKRALVYLLPRDGFFKVSFVFGHKATDEIFQSNISETIKSELKSSKVYKEGRGITLEIKGRQLMPDIQKLIEIKIKY